MKTVSISGFPRESVGKKDAKKHRKSGNIPCVLYGGKEQQYLTIKEKELIKLIYTPKINIIKLKLNDKEYDAIIQEVQFHPVTDKILHVDFLKVTNKKPVIINLPVKFEGSPVGVVLKGGILLKRLRKIRIKALIEHLPDDIIIDISNLDIGDTIKIIDIEKENLTFIDNPNRVIVSVRTARTIVEIEGETEEGEEGEEGDGEGTEGEEGAKKDETKEGDKSEAKE